MRCYICDTMKHVHYDEDMDKDICHECSTIGLQSLEEFGVDDVVTHFSHHKALKYCEEQEGIPTPLHPVSGGRKGLPKSKAEDAHAYLKRVKNEETS